jgi:hypothetical protein
VEIKLKIVRKEDKNTGSREWKTIKKEGNREWKIVKIIEVDKVNNQTMSNVITIDVQWAVFKADKVVVDNRWVVDMVAVDNLKAVALEVQAVDTKLI